MSIRSSLALAALAACAALTLHTAPAQADDEVVFFSKPPKGMGDGRWSGCVARMHSSQTDLDGFHYNHFIGCDFSKSSCLWMDMETTNCDDEFANECCTGDYGSDVLAAGDDGSNYFMTADVQGDMQGNVCLCQSSGSHQCMTLVDKWTDLTVTPWNEYQFTMAKYEPGGCSPDEMLEIGTPVSIGTGWTITSSEALDAGGTKVILQSDLAKVIFHAFGPFGQLEVTDNTGNVWWSSPPFNSPSLTFKASGDLVMTSGNVPLPSHWESGLAGCQVPAQLQPVLGTNLCSGPRTLNIEPDCNVTIRDGNGRQIWETGTHFCKASNGPDTIF